MSAADSMDLCPATDQSVARSARYRPNRRRFFPALMEAAREWFPNKTAPTLASIFGCDVRSAERHLAGDRTADGESTLALMFGRIGPKAIEAGVAQLPPEEQRIFWREIGKAAKRAEIAAEIERLQHELDEQT